MKHMKKIVLLANDGSVIANHKMPDLDPIPDVVIWKESAFGLTDVAENLVTYERIRNHINLPDEVDAT